MGDEFVVVARQAVAAALMGQDWIDATWEPGSWVHRFYSATYTLRQSSHEMWAKLCHPEKQDRYFRNRFRAELRKHGIELYSIAD